MIMPDASSGSIVTGSFFKEYMRRIDVNFECLKQTDMEDATKRIKESANVRV